MAVIEGSLEDMVRLPIYPTGFVFFSPSCHRWKGVKKSGAFPRQLCQNAKTWSRFSFESV
jgi:hypothetical protein